MPVFDELFKLMIDQRSFAPLVRIRRHIVARGSPILGTGVQPLKHFPEKWTPVFR
jgi:hypothetical protein